MRLVSFHAGDGAWYGVVDPDGTVAPPHVWLKDGDTVELEISGIGALRNPVRNEVFSAAAATAA